MVFLLFLLFVGMRFTTSPGQEISLNNYTGDWTDNTSWVDNSNPGDSIDGIDVEIFGYLSLTGDLSFDNGTFTVHDTLVINGNLHLLNSAILSIDTSGILFVDGDYYSENKVEVTSGGTLVVTGEFSMVGAEDQGSFINDGTIFIFDDTPDIKSGSEYTDLQCPDPTDYPSNCAYGDSLDISTDPVYDLFTEISCQKYDSIVPTLVLAVLSPVGSPANIPAIYSNYNAMIIDGGTATDDCSIDKSSLTHISDISDGESCPETITRTYSLSDKTGNIAYADQLIIIQDNTPPILTLPVLSDIMCIEDVPLPYSDYSALIADGGAATDNSGIDTGSLNLLSVDTIPGSVWTVLIREYEIADVCGTSTVTAQDIMVTDYSFPYLACPANVITCAENSAGSVVYDIALLNYSDNCTSPDELIITYSISGSTTTSGAGDASGTFFNNGVSIVTYTVTDKANNSTSGSFTVTINPLPSTTEISGIGSPICEASSEFYTVSANPTSKFIWETPSDATIITDTSNLGVSSIEVLYGFNSGYLTVTEITDNGCIGETKSLQIGLVGCPLVPDFEMSTATACQSDSVTFLSTSSGISPTSIYTWDFGSDAQPSVATGPGPHNVFYESAGIKSVQLTVEELTIGSVIRTIEIDKIPSLVLTGEDRCGEGPVLFTASLSDGNGVEFSIDSGISINNTDNGAPFEYTPVVAENQSITVWARGIDNNTGCYGAWSNATAMTLPLAKTGKIIAEDTNATSYLDVACSKSTKLYRVDGNAGSQYRWQIPDLGIDITGPDQIEVMWDLYEGVYTIQLQEIPGSGCMGTIEEEQVLVSYPVVDLGSDQEICEGTSYTVTADRNFDQYLWHDGSTLNSYTATGSETILLQATDEYGCTGIGAVEIIAYIPPLDLGENKQVCAPEGEELYAGEYANYQWSTGDISNSITVFSGDGTISLTVTDWNNCSATDEITILTCNETTSLIDIPEVISPNGDGIADTWIIPDIELYPDTRIMVFDMYGRTVFNVNGNYANTWDGSYGGNQLPVGRYFYLIDFNSSDLNPVSGSVTIIR